LVQEKINKLISLPSSPSEGDEVAMNAEDHGYFLWKGTEAKGYLPPARSKSEDGLLIAASFKCRLEDLRNRGDRTVAGATATDTTAEVQVAAAWQSKSGQLIDQQLLAEEFSKLPALDHTAYPHRFLCMLLCGHGAVALPGAQEIKATGSDGQRACSCLLLSASTC
jgi:hypothetical protein